MLTGRGPTFRNTKPDVVRASTKHSRWDMTHRSGSGDKAERWRQLNDVESVTELTTNAWLSKVDPPEVSHSTDRPRGSCETGELPVNGIVVERTVEYRVTEVGDVSLPRQTG